MRTYENYKSDIGLKDQVQDDFSVALNYYMRRDGVKQQDLIDDLNLSSATISAWVTGKRRPRPVAMKMLADYFHVSEMDMRRLPARVLSDKYGEVDIDENLRSLTHKLNAVKSLSIGGVELPLCIKQNILSAIKIASDYAESNNSK